MPRTKPKLVRKLHQLDAFLRKHDFGKEMEDTCAALGLLTANLVYGHDWNADMLEDLFMRQVEMIRDQQGRDRRERRRNVN